MLLGLACALGAALLYGVASVAQAVVSRRLPPLSHGWVRILLHALRSPLLIAVVAADMVGALLHLVSIDQVPLYLAQAGIAASLPITALVSGRVLRESLRAPDWCAVAATALGIAAVAFDSGAAGSTDGGPGFVAGLYLLLAGLVVFGSMAYRSHGRVSGAVLSLLSGLGYSGVTLGARILGTPDWSFRSGSVVLVMALCGVLAFWLYSFALQRLPVAGATAPLVLAETLAPTILGVLVLGDAMSAGAWPVIVAGLTLAMAGSIWLAGFEGRTRERVRESADPSRLVG